MLDKARGIANTSFIITSGLRTLASNKKAGGVKNSAHERGLAVDLRAHEKIKRDTIVKSLKAVGFVRIGVYSSHVHCDIDSTKPQVAWTGGISHA